MSSHTVQALIDPDTGRPMLPEGWWWHPDGRGYALSPLSLFCNVSSDGVVCGRAHDDYDSAIHVPMAVVLACIADAQLAGVTHG